MSLRNNLTGMRGVYLVAAELTKRGFIVSPTSRNALTADLLVTDTACRNIYAVQVKTNAKTFGFWLVSAKTSKIVSPQLIYALVNLKKDGPDYYLVPSRILAKKVDASKEAKRSEGIFHWVDEGAVARFKDKWKVFRNESIALVIRARSWRANQDGAKNFDDTLRTGVGDGYAIAKRLVDRLAPGCVVVVLDKNKMRRAEGTLTKLVPTEKISMGMQRYDVHMKDLELVEYKSVPLDRHGVAVI